jgi:hypothetical protein
VSDEDGESGRLDDAMFSAAAPVAGIVNGRHAAQYAAQLLPCCLFSIKIYWVVYF